MNYFGLEKHKIIKLSGQHNHIKNSPSKIERHVLRKNFKRHAEESMSIQHL